MVSTKIFCIVQQKKIGFYVSLIILSIIIFAITQITVVTQNAVMQRTLLQKKNNIGTKRSELTKLQKAIHFIEHKSIDNKLQQKHGYYFSVDKQKLLDEIMTKMNQAEDFDSIDSEVKKKNVEYSGFLLRMERMNNTTLEKIITKLKQQMLIMERQNIDISFESSVLKIDFQTDYEYVAYRILAMMKQLLPGYIVIKSFAIQPAREELRKLLYDKKFNKLNFTNDLIDIDKRLNCSIEIEWIFLKTINQSTSDIAG